MLGSRMKSLDMPKNHEQECGISEKDMGVSCKPSIWIHLGVPHLWKPPYDEYLSNVTAAFLQKYLGVSLLRGGALAVIVWFIHS